MGWMHRQVLIKKLYAPLLIFTNNSPNLKLTDSYPIWEYRIHTSDAGNLGFASAGHLENEDTGINRERLNVSVSPSTLRVMYFITRQGQKRR